MVRQNPSLHCLIWADIAGPRIVAAHWGASMRARSLMTAGRVAAVVSLLTTALLGPTLTSGAAAANGAVRPDPDFTAGRLPADDDGSSTTRVPLGFTANFFGDSYESVWVNNNGNITFDAPLATYTPLPLTSTSKKIIAPFWADVDTRGAGSAVASYGMGSVDGRPAFAVSWAGVGYFLRKTDRLNSFQVVLIDRSDIGLGDFDIEFNYDRVQWDTGDASQGVNGSPARVGYANAGNVSFELPGSARSGAFLDSNATRGLIHNSVNSPVPGRYVFSVRSGTVQPDTTPPEAPPAPDLVATSDSGQSTTDNVTSVRTPRFHGTAEAGSRVRLWVDGVPRGSGVSSDGRYSIRTERLSPGRHVVYAVATDTASNASPESTRTAFRVITGTPCQVNPVHPGRMRVGDGGRNLLRGSAAGDLIDGRGGADTVRAGDGNDCANGGSGNDVLSGAGGSDEIQAGAGNDSVEAGPGRDRVYAGDGSDSIQARDGVGELVDCGRGRRDRAVGDRRDRFVGCESVTRR